ncbi:MAG: hypothetical protein AAGE01_17225 [Pseudomonadota bacterium]
MSIFEHVSVFISIILGLGVVHLLGGISLILDTRVRARVYWIHLLWTANLLLLSVLVWLANFVLSPLETFSAPHILNLVAYSMTIYLMCGLLYPVRGGEVTDFREHFHANRVRFYVVGLLFVATDALDGVLERQVTHLDFNPFQYGTLGVWAGCFMIAMLKDEEWIQGTTVVVFFLGLLGFLESLIRTGVIGS